MCRGEARELGAKLIDAAVWASASHVQEATDEVNDLAAGEEDVARAPVENQVEVTLHRWHRNVRVARAREVGWIAGYGHTRRQGPRGVVAWR